MNVEDSQFFERQPSFAAANGRTFSRVLIRTVLASLADGSTIKRF